MLKIGINENAYIKSVSKSEEGTLIIGFAQAGDVDNSEQNADLKAAMEFNPFADWEDGAESFSESTNVLNIRIFPFDADPNMFTPDVLPDATEMRNRLASLRDPLTHLLLGYMTKDKNPLKPAVMFRNTGIDPMSIATFAERIVQEDVIAKVYENIVDAFIEAITPFVNNENYLFRVKFPRRSKKKAFASIPTKYIGEQPFWESMAIPAEASRVKFSNFEIKNGLDKDTPYAGVDDADAAPAGTAGVAEPESDPFAAR